METQNFSLEEELVLIGIDTDNPINALAILSNHLLLKGYVKETFPLAVQEREKVHPTGLPTIGVGVAIPHTDIEHVVNPAIAIGILTHPVKFQAMGNPEEEVEVDLIFMLAIKNPQMQVQMLKKLTSIFENEKTLKDLKNMESPCEVISLIRKEMEVGSEIMA